MNNEKKQEIIQNITDVFVNNYSVIKKSQELTNNYLLELNIKDIYTYDAFCVDFINKTKIFIDNISMNDNITLNNVDFTKSILSFMIEEKIKTCDLVEDDKKTILLRFTYDKNNLK